jgi:hypothetical protein
MSPQDRRSRADVHLLWGRSARFPRPQLITAFSGGLVDAMVEEHEERRNEAIDWFLSFDDGDRADWTFWETVEELLVVAPAICATCRRPEQDRFEACECETPQLETTCECGQANGSHTRYCPSGPEPT